MQAKFQTQINNHESILKNLNTRFNIIGYIKLAQVLLLAFVIYLMFSRGFPAVLIILFATLTIGLIILWVFHTKLGKKISFSKGIIAIHKQHIARITGEWTSFKDIGAEFIDLQHPYSSDLDIVGGKSLFQFLNTTHTWHGRHAFANDLLCPAYKRHEINKRQEAIAELSQDIEFTGKMEYHLSKIGVDASTPKFVEYLKDSTPFISNKPLKIALTCVPAVVFLLIAGIFMFRQSNMYFVAVLLVIMQMAVWAVGMIKARNHLVSLTNLPYKLSAYNEIIEIIANSNFTSDKLRQMQSELNEAANAIQSLGKIANKVNIIHNPLIYMALNALLLWDYHCAISLDEWKQKYAHQAEGWFHAIGEFESLMSFSQLPNVVNNTCLPEIINKGNCIEATNLGHPLLPNEKRVNNEFTLNNNIFIVSGSNMSGKTTFLRTVGINIVLARAGSFVCADSMLAFPLNVVTSMRLADDLSEGVSTFYAELTRIKSIITIAKEQPNILFLIDEIFRGTNSIDRLTGAKTVLETLNTLGAAGLISTHDLELCELANTLDRVKNFNFAEHYTNDEIRFDYKIKHGKSHTTNAKYLMKMIGLMD